jgi:hypothetical protein
VAEGVGHGVVLAVRHLDVVVRVERRIRAQPSRLVITDDARHDVALDLDAARMGGVIHRMPLVPVVHVRLVAVRVVGVRVVGGVVAAVVPTDDVIDALVVGGVALVGVVVVVGATVTVVVVVEGMIVVAVLAVLAVGTGIVHMTGHQNAPSGTSESNAARAL